MSDKRSPAGTNGWEFSCEQTNFIHKAKASGACSSGLPLTADLAVSGTSIKSTVNAILYNSLISIRSPLAMLPMQGVKRANYFLMTTVSWNNRAWFSQQIITAAGRCCYKPRVLAWLWAAEAHPGFRGHFPSSWVSWRGKHGLVQL